MPDKYTAKDWDDVRAAFASSIMVNTALSSLAQNLDGPDWPVKGKDETPAKYIELPYDEMVALLVLKGQPPTRADQLIGMLKDTLAFDDPFGDMVAQTAAAEKKDNQMLKNMARLEIPEAFPIALTALGPDTREFCKLEKLTTLGGFAVFAQDMSQNVIVGGDFRRLLNSLSHIDEQTLAQCLPFRPGAKGLHLFEALAQAAAAPAPAERAAAAAEWFKPELDALKQDLAAGGSLSRHLVVLGNPAAEAKVAELLKPLLGSSRGMGGEKKSGFFSKLFKK
ncbi:MAG TPA: hypothetical protein VG838_07685 [Opitutaceae bacterium]|nr:hypothetical protein [Opitutaceae bacterium]